MKYHLTVIAVIVVLAARPMGANAAFTVKTEDKTVVQGASSFFDVFAEVTLPADDISGWQLMIELDPTAAGLIVITGIGAPTAPHPNVFPGEIPFAVLPLTTSLAAVTNFPAGVGSFESLDDQDGFVRVFFDVLPGTPVGTYDITIDPASAEIVDNTTPTPVPLPFGIANGSINVVPEPSTLTFAAIALLGLLAYDHRRRRA